MAWFDEDGDEPERWTPRKPSGRPFHEPRGFTVPQCVGDVHPYDGPVLPDDPGDIYLEIPMRYGKPGECAGEFWDRYYSWGFYDDPDRDSSTP